MSSQSDVAVIGGGPAGIAAALAAATSGARTLLVERDAALGGNASQALVHTICGLYLPNLDHPQPAHPGFPSQFAEALVRARGATAPEPAGRVHYLPIQPPAFAALARRACEAAAPLELALGTTLRGLTWPTSSSDEAELELEGPEGPTTWRARIVVDTTGEAGAAALASADTVMEPIDALQRPSFIFRMRGVDAAGFDGFERLRITTAIGRAARTGEIPEACESLVVRGDGRPGSLYATLTLPQLADRPYAPLDAEYLAVLHRAAQSQAEAVVAFLRRERKGFAHATVADWPARVGIRETRRVVGLEVIEREDILEARAHPDEVALSTWPIELWSDHRRPSYEYPTGPASIPLGALVSRTHPQLGMAGRCLSASHEALGALRVIGTALATGQAIGVAAALAADSGTSLAKIASDRVRDQIEVLGEVDPFS
ncbi:MAG: FAD-dependent oxidoreductase [Myxococcota bacterium]